MIDQYDVQLTVGYVMQHAPARSAQGLEGALIDIAQDLLLRHLSSVGVLDLFVFKGGTSLRKTYAGTAGRFSTDLDFSIAHITDDLESAQALLVETINHLEIHPFRYEVVVRNQKPTIVYFSEFGDAGKALESKIDVGPPPWLTPEQRFWVPVPVHKRYGGPLPQLPVMNLSETVAEKIARLNRKSLPRDAYDLCWIARTNQASIDRELVRRVAVLKCWVDIHGLTAQNVKWSGGLPSARGFDADGWKIARTQDDFDDDFIGMLTSPAPNMDDLGRDLTDMYRWVSDLDTEENIISQGHAGDRALVLRLLSELPGGRLNITCW